MIKNYNIEVIDCETDFTRYGGKWGYDYVEGDQGKVL